MTANPVKPSRYRAGKAVGPESSSDSESGEEASDAEETKRTIAPPPKVPSAGKIISDLSKVNIAERARRAQEDESRRLAAQKAARAKEEEEFVTDVYASGRVCT